ncbi:MAG: efflux RND transporter periplasmic adaptor subunit, partial [Muribaculum sp.]|nr:efflux RND transporter periplasmic adaptor subunit [Muribaculum sp.]
QVVADVDEADIGQVKEGQRVTFTVDAYPNDIFDGTVVQKRLSPTTESNVVTYEVIVSASNPEHKLIPGLTANLTIYITEENNVLLVPVKATRFTPHDYQEAKNLPQPIDGADTTPYKSVNPDKKRVWIERDEKLVPVEITVGVNNGVNIVVEAGLQQGDRVAIEYSAESVEEKPDGGAQGSPFAPKPPSRKK